MLRRREEKRTSSETLKSAPLPSLCSVSVSDVTQSESEPSLPSLMATSMPETHQYRPLTEHSLTSQQIGMASCLATVLK